VWVKDNHGTGDLKGAFAPKHERVIHAVLGSPLIHDRKPDVLECAKSATSDHPTEKPVGLLKSLIEATTVSGDLVIDPFGGVGSTCVAASECGRSWFGSELEESYYKVGLKRLGGGNG
jgi:site-specific DNA-methyltransferase (adenine-specific)